MNGVQTCENPGTGATQCGAGITKGYTLNMKIIWASGSPALDDTFNAEIADWGTIGIQFSHTDGHVQQRDRATATTVPATRSARGVVAGPTRQTSTHRVRRSSRPRVASTLVSTATRT